MTLFELNKPKHVETDYLNEMKEGLVDRISNGIGPVDNRVELSESVKRILIPGIGTENKDEERIKTLLIGEPSELWDLNRIISEEIEENVRENHRAEIENNVHNGQRRPSEEEQEQDIKDKLKDINDKLEKIFNYDGIFNTPSKSKAYKLSLKIGANTCCYCNRQYTFTVITNGNGNRNERITRPAFDHWFPKSRYPLLSISLYNLIPCCTICNSSAKGDQDVNLDNYIHPYVKLEPKPEIEFKAVPSMEDGKRWTTKIERRQDSREDNTIKLFHLDEIYKMHDLLELKDIMDFKENYSEGYLKELMDLLKSKSINPSLTTKDVYRMLFGVEIDDEKNLDRPFSKMKNDILKKILKSNF